jgi:hypothetical protein
MKDEVIEMAADFAMVERLVRQSMLAGTAASDPAADMAPSLELFWIPLGADGRVVRRCGRIYERIAAGRRRRPPCDLYHAALVATISSGRCTIEMTPVPDANGAQRGVVAEGAVGAAFLGRWRMFRYEIRCWPGGCIPDLDHAIGPPVVVSRNAAEIAKAVELIRDVPTYVWGRDVVGVGDMWSCNSVARQRRVPRPRRPSAGRWPRARVDCRHRSGCALVALRVISVVRAAGRQVAAGSEGPRRPTRVATVGRCRCCHPRRGGRGTR